MSKIAIHLDYPIIDGEQVTFRSPCASADANGLRIYTPTSYEDATETSTDYTMKDADGNTLNGKASLFAAGAYVTVALDTANAIAYLYNARSIYQAELDTKLNKTGDAADAKIGSSTASTATYPIPAANDTFKVILGKIIKFFGDIKAAYTNVSISGKKITFTTAAGGTKEITTQDTTYGLASTTADGLLRKLDSNTAHYMRGDGTWQTPPNTTYGLSSTSANGLLRKLDNNTAHYMRGDGTWQTPPNTNTWRPVQNNLTSTSTTDSLSAAMGKALKDQIKDLGAIVFQDPFSRYDLGNGVYIIYGAKIYNNISVSNAYGSGYFYNFTCSLGTLVPTRVLAIVGTANCNGGAYSVSIATASKTQVTGFIFSTSKETNKSIAVNFIIMCN